MILRITTRSEDETKAFGERLGALLQGGDIIVLGGDLGAGKTQLTKGVARALGVTQEITSPTFNLVLEYPTLLRQSLARGNSLRRGGAVSSEKEQSTVSSERNQHPELPPNFGEKNQLPGQPRHFGKKEQFPRLLRHFDLYRLERAEQLDDLDYFGLVEEEDVISLVEWGNKFSESMPLAYLLVSIEQSTLDSEQRLLKISARGARPEELLAQLVVTEEGGLHG